jgi:hypothetical protein
MRIISILDIVRNLSHLLLVICYLLGHNGLLRGGELTSGFKVKDFIWDADFLGFKLCLLRTKTYRTGEATFVHYRDNNSPYSLVKLMTRWFDINNLWLTGDRIVLPSIVKSTTKKEEFSFDWSKPMSYNHLRLWLLKHVKAIGLDPKRFGLHSLRAGGGTDLFASRRLSLVQIMFMGRWKSVEAAMKYYRDEANIAQTVSNIFGEIFGQKLMSWV